MPSQSSAQRLGLRLISKAGALSVMDKPEVRDRVGRLLTRGAHSGFTAQAAVGRQFAKRQGKGDPTRVASSAPRGVFDLTPTEDQAMLRDAARELATEVIRPAAAAADTERSVPADVASAAADMGLTLVGVPAELDGIAEERSAVAGCLVLEELARGDMGIAVALMSTAAVATAIASYGNADQQATYLPHFTGAADAAADSTGKATAGADGQAATAPAAALAFQEPQPLFDPLAPKTTGTSAGDTVTLQGTKALVSGADHAELFVVSALIDGTARMVIVEANTPGLKVEDDPAMGVRAARTGRLLLDGVEVPAGNLLGSPEDYVDAVRRARLAWGAAAVGTAQAVLDQLTTYVKERKAFGEPIGYRQAVGFTVADIAIELEALRLTVWKAAARLDSGKDAAQVVAEVRALTARHGAVIGSNAVQLLGGHGFVKEFDNERWYRDLRGAGVLEGTLLV